MQVRAGDGLARHYSRDVRVGYRAVVVDAATPHDEVRARQAAARALVFTPLEFLEKLAASIPRPRIDRVVYHGVE